MTLFLIRHANTDATGKAISGRAKDVLLNEEGLKQAEQLAAGMAESHVQSIRCSPLERARQTAEPLARRLSISVEIADVLSDIDFGDWTGGLLTKLEGVEEWRQWNLFRSGLRVPNGEAMIEVQARMLKEVEQLRKDFPTGQVAMVSHADPIRTVLAYFLGMPLDLLHRMEISPASVSILEINSWGAQVQRVNMVFSEQLPSGA